MRSAQPDEPSSNGDSFSENGAPPTDSGVPHIWSQSRTMGWWAMRIGVGLIVLGGLVTGAIFLFRGGSPTVSSSHPPPATTPPPSRTAFQFQLSSTRSVPTGKRNSRAVQEAAAKVQATLSAFYDAAFMDPAARRQALPASAWNAFARAVQKQARSDAASLTLGEAGATIDTLSVRDATLSVRVLLDPQGRPQAAVATVAFDASGTLSGGGPVLVTNRASFLLRPAGATWVVVGYPAASTDVQSPTPSPGATGSPTPAASGSPTAGASP